MKVERLRHGYPHYVLDPTNTFGLEVDVDWGTIERWEAARNAFLEAQAEMALAYRKAWEASYEAA